MAAITWDETLSVKINSIDLQHKKLIDLINSFYENLDKNSNKEKILTLIRALKDYTLFHFSSEEKYMKLAGYPDFEKHRIEHQKFVATVQDFEDRYEHGKLLLSIEITGFIKEWITKHIKGVDRKYSDLLVQKGIE
jgi:hemerythrin